MSTNPITRPTHPASELLSRAAAALAHACEAVNPPQSPFSVDPRAARRQLSAGTGGQSDLMKCILHIGVHKTGTTSIQNALHGYDDGRVFYADLGVRNHSGALGTLFQDNHMADHWRTLGTDVEEKIQFFESKLEAALSRERDAIIFSGEDISTFDKSCLERMRSRLERSCDQFDIIMFVRDPLKWAASGVQQRVKHNPIPVEHAKPISFERRYTNISHAFSDSRIEVLKYEDAVSQFGGTVQFFIKHLNLDESSINIDDSFANISMSESAFRVLVRFNKLNISLRKSLPFAHSHWRFIDGVSDLLSDARKMNPLDYLGVCNLQDYAFLKEQLGIHYEAPDIEDGRQLPDFTDIDRDSLVKIRDFLVERGLHYPWDKDPDAAICALYHCFVADELKKDQARKLRALAAERDALMAERDLLARRLGPAAEALTLSSARPGASWWGLLDYAMHKALSECRWLPARTRQRLGRAAEKRQRRWALPE